MYHAKSPKMSGEISKDAFVIYLFIYMLCLLTVFNYLWEFHSGGPLLVFNIFEENILDHSPSICFKTFVNFFALIHICLEWSTLGWVSLSLPHFAVFLEIISCYISAILETTCFLTAGFKAIIWPSMKSSLSNNSFPLKHEMGWK